MVDVLFLNSTESATMKMEINGTMLLATKLLHNGFSVNILRFHEIRYYKQDYNAFISAAVERILKEEPKCLSCYTLWPYFHIMLRITSEVKKKNPEIITILGGPQASFSAAATMESMPFVDYICSGEGEETVVPFFRALLQDEAKNLKEIPGLYYRENGKATYPCQEAPLADMEMLPYWDDRLFNGKEEAFTPRITAPGYHMMLDVGRGCPFNCSFCCTSKFLHRRHRLKSPERIMEDIRYYHKTYGIRSFQFSHDAFTTNQKMVSRFCDLLIESDMDISWSCSSRIDLLSEDLILKMKSAGMVRIDLGLETGSERMQKLTNKRLNIEKTKNTISFLLKNKIKVSLFFMYGFPEEEESDLAKTLDLLFWAVDSGVSHISMAYCRFYPGADITAKYYDQLFWNPNAKKLSRGIFGYKEEKQLILDNKKIFPFYYDLDTTVRREYQYAYFLAHMYEKLPYVMKHIRALYKGDNLRFYRDFYNTNFQVFSQDVAEIVKITDELPEEMLLHLLEKFQEPYIKYLRGLLEFESDKRKIAHAKKDTMSEKWYDFSYVDYRLQLPIDKYSDGRTQIRMEKNVNTTKMKVLKIE